MEYLDSTRHVVIDIETLGLEVGCPIIQIGAVEVFKDFGKWSIGKTFSTGISIESNIAEGFIKISNDTLDFWSKNRIVFEDIFEKPCLPIGDALDIFRKTICEDTDFYWSKGTDFDFPILKHALRRFGWREPWKYNQIRDIRTICDSMFYGAFVPKVNNHDALSDAINEANILIAVLTRMAKLRQD